MSRNSFQKFVKFHVLTPNCTLCNVPFVYPSPLRRRGQGSSAALHIKYVYSLGNKKFDTSIWLSQMNISFIQ